LWASRPCAIIVLHSAQPSTARADLPISSPNGSPPSRHGSVFVAAGILASRVVGFVRLRVFAHYFGLQSDVADAFNAAIRIPNFLQNLFGEGALSASFIPVYAALVARGDRRDADRLAGVIATLLALLVSVFVLAGVIFAPALVAVIAPGFAGEKRALTILLVRILFPGVGLLTFSAWCLGVLNSHRRFLLSYAAPVLWNAAMIGALVAFGPVVPLPRLAIVLAWSSVAGSALQFLVQLPVVLRVAPDVRPSLRLGSHRVRTVVANFLPALVSRGVVQISAYIDALLASLLPTGAVTGLANAQLLYTLPVSLFGMSVAAAELPAMAGAADAVRRDRTGGEGGSEALRARLQAGLRRIAFFVVPSAMGFLALGDVIAAAILQTGRFRREDAVYVWGILAGSAVGLLASTLGRLYSSAFFALHDTRSPLRFALVRVGAGIVLGYVFAILLPPLFGVPRVWGTAGLTAASGIAAWIEMLMLRHGISQQIGATALPSGYLAKLWAAAAGAAAASWAIKLLIPPLHPIVTGVLVLAPYAAVFAALTLAFQIPEAERLAARRRRQS
jgi:putative peptidoglycan lipid II flippase